MKNTRILMITRYPILNDSRIIKEANSLVKAGYNLTVIFASKDVDNSSYLFQTKRLDGPRKDLNKLLKLFFHFILFFKIIKEGIKVKPEICHVHDLNTLVEGNFISIICNAKLIYDSHELFYESIEQFFKNDFSKKNTILKVIEFLTTRLLKFVEKFFGKRAVVVITVNEKIAELLKENIGKKTNIEVIKNCVEKKPEYLKFKKNIFYELIPELKNKFILLNQGNTTSSRFDNVVLEALKEIENVVLVLLGTIHPDFKNILFEEIKRKKIEEKVFILDAVKREDLYKYTSSANVGLILQNGVLLNNYYSLPNKFFEYISTGTPILSSNMYCLEKLILENEIGAIYEYGSKNSFIFSLEKIMGKEVFIRCKENAKELYLNRLNWEIEEKKLLEIYYNLSK